MGDVRWDNLGIIIPKDVRTVVLVSNSMNSAAGLLFRGMYLCTQLHTRRRRWLASQRTPGDTVAAKRRPGPPARTERAPPVRPATRPLGTAQSGRPLGGDWRGRRQTGAGGREQGCRCWRRYTNGSPKKCATGFDLLCGLDTGTTGRQGMSDQQGQATAKPLTLPNTGGLTNGEGWSAGPSLLYGWVSPPLTGRASYI